MPCGGRRRDGGGVTFSPVIPRGSRLPLALRISSVGAPVCLLLYGVLRLVDGLDNGRGPGLAWDAGHAMFFAAFVLLAVLIAGLRALVPDRVPWHRTVANIAATAGLAGAASFLWVILGDLFGSLHDNAPLPAPLHAAGPLLFEAGLLTLLAQLAIIAPRRLPARTPVLVFLGLAPIAVSLDILPVGAVLVLLALFPLGRPSPAAAPPAQNPSTPAAPPTDPAHRTGS